MTYSPAREERERVDRLIAALNRVHAAMVKRVKASPPRTLSTLWRWYEDEVTIHRHIARRMNPPSFNDRSGWSR